MEKETLRKYLVNFQKDSIFLLRWETRNTKPGELLEEMVRFEGFDDKGNPEIVFSGGARLDYGKIKYSDIVNIEEQCPDGYCVSKGNCSGCSTC